MFNKQNINKTLDFSSSNEEDYKQLNNNIEKPYIV